MMDQQIRLLLTDLTSQHGLDETFVDRIMSAMKKPITQFTEEPVAENETVLSTVSVVEKGIGTVVLKIKGEFDSMIGKINTDEITPDKALILQLTSLKEEYKALKACFWSAIKKRLKEEGATQGRNKPLVIRKDFQIVALPQVEKDFSSTVSMLKVLEGASVVVQVCNADHSNVPTEKLEGCECPLCRAELGRRKVAEDM